MAFEIGYKALPGVKAIDVTKWGDFKKILKQLDSPQAKELYGTIIIDTVDIAYDLCGKFIASQEGADSVETVEYGKGYTKTQREFDERIRQITQMGYGLVLISHAQDKTLKDEDGKEYNQIQPTVDKRGMLVCSRLCDIIGFAKPVQTDAGSATKLYMRGTPRFIAGTRFKYLTPVIDFSYDNLVNAIIDAIDEQEKESNSDYFTDESHVSNIETKLDFDDLFKKCQNVINDYMKVDAEYYRPRITEVIENELGKGKMLKTCSRDQAEQLDVILYELDRIPTPPNKE